MHFFKIILSIFNLIHIIVSQSETFTHKLIVDDNNPDQFVLYWKIVKDEIIFEAKCKTTGYVAVGISPNGGMAGADIAIGWVDDKSGKGYLKDCHATSKSQPIVDEQQDWFLESSSQKDGYTTIKMRRKLQTCDNNDLDIIDGSTFMIFAWNRDDPDYNLNNWKYHGVNRKTKTALLLDFKEKSINDNQLPPDTITFDAHPDYIHIPTKDTYYHCETIKLPVFNQDMHLIQYEMLINKENEDIVHHYDVHECDDDFDYPEKYALDCMDDNQPKEVSQKCSNRLFIAWSIGGQYTYNFPSVAGFPLIRANKTKYISVSIHYDNHKINRGRVDTSGIRFYVTPTLRKYDAGLITLGNMGINGPLSFTVPPNVNSITFSSICYPECMNSIDGNGIYVFAGVMHTHLLGKSVRTSLVRKDKIIKNLLYNPNYDFNYQYLFEIEPTKVEKDDILITECTYSSKNYENFTFIGASTRDEMCYTFVYYYPALNIKYCGSAVTTSEIKTFYNDLLKDSIIPSFEFNETMSLMNQLNISHFLKTQVRGSKDLADRYTKFFESRYLDEPKCGDAQSNATQFTPRIRYEPLNDLTIKSCIKSSSNKITSTIIVIYLFVIYSLIL